MRKWVWLMLVAAIAIAAIVACCLSVPHETVTFKFVGAFNGRPLHATVAIDEHTTPYFHVLEKLFQRFSLFASPAPKEHVCQDGLLKIRLAKHPRRETTLICSSSFHQTVVLSYCDGTNRLDALGLNGVFTNFVTYSLVLVPTNGVVTVRLYPFTDFPLH